MTIPDDVTAWLLASDPALRWQVERDLLGADESVWRATRARVASEGFGAALLAEQDAAGTWAGGAFFPVAGHPSAWVEGQEGQPWTATTWTLNSLRDWGLDAAALAGTAEKLASVRWEYDDLPYWGGEVDVCINAWTLANGTWLGADVTGLVDWFAEHQLDDGGWNCEWEFGSTRSSFHSTICALTGLLYREVHGPGGEGIAKLRHRGEEYLLSRRLLYRASTGEVVRPWVSEFTSPPRHRYSALRALGHFRQASAVDRTPPDERLADAVELVRGKRQPDGRWLRDAHLPGQEWFDVDAAVGDPSPWLTLDAYRVLTWWDDARADPPPTDEGNR